MLSLLIVNGLVMDGSGNEAFRAGLCPRRPSMRAGWKPVEIA
jgi:hypothetical protein